MSISKKYFVHKRHTVFTDEPITVTGTRLPTAADLEAYGHFLAHFGSDIPYVSWWIDNESEKVDTMTPCVIKNNHLASNISALPAGVRPMLLFRCSEDILEIGDTFVLYDTDFIVVDTGIALALRCIGRAPYAKAQETMQEWFNDRIDRPLNTVIGDIPEGAENSPFVDINTAKIISLQRMVKELTRERDSYKKRAERAEDLVEYMKAL